MKLDFSELNSDNAMKALSQVRSAMDRSDYVVDFEKVGDVDSTTIALALQWLKLAQAKDRKLTLVNVPESFWKLADLYRVRRFFE